MLTSPRETTLCRYHYDPLDRQAGCTLTRLQPATLQRFYCKSRLATEIQGAVGTHLFQHDDQLLAQHRHQNDKVDTTLLATDQQRSVLSALDTTRPHPLAYAPYGHRPAESGLLSLLGFNGERPDPVTGHYHLGNGYRQFNPVLMRFNSPDSWSPFGEGGLNAYAYCKGEPVLGSDPTGHSIFSSIWKGVRNKFGRTPLKLRKPIPDAPSTAALSKTEVQTRVPEEITKYILKDSQYNDLYMKQIASDFTNGTPNHNKIIELENVFWKIEHKKTGREKIEVIADIKEHFYKIHPYRVSNTTGETTKINFNREEFIANNTISNLEKSNTKVRKT